MPFEPFTADVEIVSKLPDNPTGSGIPAAELKASFDRAAVLLKDYINTVLYPEIGKSVDVDAAITAFLDKTLTSDDHPAGAKAAGDAIRGLFTGAVHSGDYVPRNGFGYEMGGLRTISISAGKAVMQGNLVSAASGNVELEAGEVGLNRNDLIVLRFSRTADGIVTVSFAAVKGTETSGPPSDPTASGDDINTAGAVTRDLPLYRVTFSGTGIASVTPLFIPEEPTALLQFTNVVVPADSFQEYTAYEEAGISHRAAVPLSGVTADMWPDVTFSPIDALDGVMVCVAESYAGGVYLFATEKPGADVTVPLIAVRKRA